MSTNVDKCQQMSTSVNKCRQVSTNVDMVTTNVDMVATYVDESRCGVDKCRQICQQMLTKVDKCQQKSTNVNKSRHGSDKSRRGVDKCRLKSTPPRKLKIRVCPIQARFTYDDFISYLNVSDYMYLPHLPLFPHTLYSFIELLSGAKKSTDYYSG